MKIGREKYPSLTSAVAASLCEAWRRGVSRPREDVSHRDTAATSTVKIERYG